MGTTFNKTDDHGRSSTGRGIAPPPARSALWAGYLLSGLTAIFLAFDAGAKVFTLPASVEGTTQLGYPASVVAAIGWIQLICLAVHLIPRSAILGAILLTGYLGGAVATHVRMENPLWSHVLFPVYVGVFLWAGLWLRDRRTRALLSDQGAFRQ